MDNIVAKAVNLAIEAREARWDIVAEQMKIINSFNPKCTDIGRVPLYELEMNQSSERTLDFPKTLSYTVPLSVNTTESVLFTGHTTMYRTHKCNCEITTLMREGCRCGGT